MNIKIVGIGGIGSHLVFPLLRYLTCISHEFEVTLFDGDEFEQQNVGRQDFLVYGNKAETTALRLQDVVAFPVRAKPVFLTEENIFLYIRNNDIVLSCVDNHATRKALSDHCETLADVALISGGNEYTDGNVQLFMRRAGEDLCKPITYLHPEIAHPEDRNPGELSCEERAKRGSPQLIVTNVMVASLMLSAFWHVWKVYIGEESLRYSEHYFDLVTGNARTVLRS